MPYCWNLSIRWRHFKKRIFLNGESSGREKKVIFVVSLMKSETINSGQLPAFFLIFSFVWKIESILFIIRWVLVVHLGTRVRFHCFLNFIVLMKCESAELKISIFLYQSENVCLLMKAEKILLHWIPTIDFLRLPNLKKSPTTNKC
jgi:hypothetical protein